MRFLNSSSLGSKEFSLGESLWGNLAVSLTTGAFKIFAAVKTFDGRDSLGDTFKTLCFTLKLSFAFAPPSKPLCSGIPVSRNVKL